MTAALQALGKDVHEGQVNKVLGAEPKRGARWEEALSAIQYFGCRGTLVIPSCWEQLKGWSDKGVPVLIGWNPEGRPWSHASVVRDVSDTQITIMDPNVPDPSLGYRVLDRETFHKTWMENFSDTLVLRRPALAVELEVSAQGAYQHTKLARRPKIMNHKLKSEIVKAAHANPEARVELLGLLQVSATMGKTAMPLGKRIFQEMVDIKKMYAARKYLKEAGDLATEELLTQVMSKLMEELEPRNPRVQHALNRVANAIERPGSGLGNQIYKAAQELGI